MKKAIIAVLLLAALATGWFIWQKNGALPSTNIVDEEIIDEDTSMQIDDSVTDTGTTEPEPMVLDEDGSPISDDMASVNAEILKRLEAQAELGLDGEELTDEDIKLIEEILDAITSSVEGQSAEGQ